ncbi:MAG: bifunctional phosphoglucose/phosphomannose isomerase, partial [Chloroflexota bacterium]
MTIRVNLDNLSIQQQYDPEGMLAAIRDLPDQCRQAWQETMAFNLPESYTRVNKAVVLGMGGSAIGSDLVRSLVLTEAKIPIIIQRDYDLPAFVDDKTLVIASSYSGNTEETLNAFEQALKT